MADNMINLAGNQALPPDIARQQAEATRQQQLANLLTQQGTQALPTGSMVSGHFVPTSPFQYLAQYGNIAAGNYLAGKSTEEAQKTAKALRDYYGQELQTYKKLQKENPDEALLFGANAYNPALSASATKQLTQGPKWEKVEKLDSRGNTITGMVDVNAPNPEMTFRTIGMGKQAISPAEAARLNWEGIPYAGGGGVTGGAPVGAPVVGTSPVIRNNAPVVSVAPNAPAYAQGSVTLNQPNAGNVPINPTVAMSGISPKAQQEMRTEQVKKTQENVNNAYEVYKVAGEIKNLLPKAHGSGIGAGMGYLANMFDIKSPQNVADEQLKVLSSRILMQVPRFQGPQSDKDVATYKEAAGSLADPTKSIASRQAALNVIIDMNKKYAPNLDWSFGEKVPAPQANTPKVNTPQAASKPPAGVDPALWAVMTPQEKALWQK